MYGYTHQSRDAMIAVKSMMELQIDKLIEYHMKIDATERQRVTMFFDSVERYVASLFVARMVDNNYLVRSIDAGLEIRFSASGHATAITFMIPTALKWEVKKMINQVAKPQASNLSPVMKSEFPTSEEDPYLASSQRRRAAYEESIRSGEPEIVSSGCVNGSVLNQPSKAQGSYTSPFDDTAPIRLDTVQDVINYLNEQDRRNEIPTGSVGTHAKYDPMCVTEDFIFPREGEGRGSHVEVLPEGRTAKYDPMSITQDCFFGTWAQSQEELMSREAYDKAMKVVG